MITPTHMGWYSGNKGTAVNPVIVIGQFVAYAAPGIAILQVGAARVAVFISSLITVSAPPVIATVDWTKPIQYIGKETNPVYPLRVLATDAPSSEGLCVVLMDRTGGLFRRRLDGTPLTTQWGHVAVENIPPPKATMSEDYVLYRNKKGKLALLKREYLNDKALADGAKVLGIKTLTITEGDK